MRRKKIIKILILICCGLVFVIGFGIGEKFFLRSSSKPKKQEIPKVIQPELQEKETKQKEELILSSQEEEEEKEKIKEGKEEGKEEGKVKEEEKVKGEEEKEKIKEEKKEKEIRKKEEVKKKIEKEEKKKVEKVVEEEVEEEKELISPKKQPPKTSNIHIALSKAPSNEIPKEKKYYYKKQIFASHHKDKALAIKRLLLKEFSQIQVEIKPVKIDDKLIYRVILLSTTPEQIEDIKNRIEDISKTSGTFTKQPTNTTKKRQIQIFATSDPNKASLIKKHLKELNYDVEVSKTELQPENIIYRIYLQGKEEEIIKQAQNIEENKIIEEIFKSPYLKKVEKVEKKEEKEVEGKYIIQVASSTNPQNAENLLKQLRETSKLPAYIKVVKTADRVEYKVRLLGLDDRETTIKFAQELLNKGIISSYIILKE